MSTQDHLTAQHLHQPCITCINPASRAHRLHQRRTGCITRTKKKTSAKHATQNNPSALPHRDGRGGVPSQHARARARERRRGRLTKSARTRERGRGRFTKSARTCGLPPRRVDRTAARHVTAQRAVKNARFLEVDYLYEDSGDSCPKNSEIIQESSRIFLSHSEEDYLRRERKVIYEDSGGSCQ